MPEQITRDELQKLDKRQLIAFILNNIAKSPGDVNPPACNAAAPPGFDDIKLPPKPALVLPGAPGAGPGAPLKAPPIPKIPPIAGDACGDFSRKKKQAATPEQLAGEKRIFVKCERCDKTFIIDLPKKIVLDNPLEIVPVTILHHPEHALTVYLDQNFESRRDYVSEIFHLK
ncbi:MAG: hypothetical protein JW839_07975 [Candidatus Lokiarchaeota archaeon]|nr:hypothetical protein [Candidatus Lokiarchaeota archaeon]